MNLKIKTIYSLKDFLGLEKSWNELFSSGNYTFFQTFNYNYLAFENMLSKNNKNKLNIIFIKNGDKAVCICPFYSDKNGVLRFINDIHSDFCDILLDNQFTFKEISLIEKSIMSYRFINIKKDSQLLKVFKNNNFKYVYKENNARFSYINLLKGEFPENNKNLKSKYRHRIRGVVKKNKQSRHMILSYKEQEFPLDEIVLLRDKMIKLNYRNKEYLDSFLIGLLKDLYEKNELIVSKITKNEKIQALSFILVQKNQYLIWIDMFDNSKMINIFNYISLLTNLSAKSNVEFHFGRGDYDYKIKNFCPVVDDLISINAFQNKFLQMRFLILTFLINTLKPIYKKFIQ